MFKNGLRLFCSAFLITLLLVVWLTVFFVVDASNDRFQSGRGTTAFSLRTTDGLHYEVDFLGQTYRANLEQVNRAAAWRKRYACLVTPRIVTILEQAYSAARWELRQ